MPELDGSMPFGSGVGLCDSDARRALVVAAQYGVDDAVRAPVPGTVLMAVGSGVFMFERWSPTPAVDPGESNDG